MDVSMDPVIRQAIAAVLRGKHCDTGANKAYNAIYDMVCVRCRNTDEARAVCNLLVKTVAVEMDAVCTELAWSPDGVEGPATFLRVFNWSKHVHVQLEKGIMATACSAWPNLDTSKKLQREIFLKITGSAGSAKVGDCMARWMARAVVVANTDLQQRLRGAQVAEEHGALDACVELLAASALPSDAAILDAEEDFCLFLEEVYKAFEEMFEDPWTLMRPHLVSYLSAIAAPADSFVYLTQLLQYALPSVRDRLRELALELTVDPHIAVLQHAFRRLVEAADTGGMPALLGIFNISREYGSRLVQPVIAELLQANTRLDDLVATVDRIFWARGKLEPFDLCRNVEAEVEKWLGDNEADSRAHKLAAYVVMRVTRSRPESWIADFYSSEKPESWIAAFHGLAKEKDAPKAPKEVNVVSLRMLLQKTLSQDLLGMELRRCLTIRLATATSHDEIEQIKESMAAFLHPCPASMHWRRELLELLTDTACISIKRDSNGCITADCGANSLLTGNATATAFAFAADVLHGNVQNAAKMTGRMDLTADITGNNVQNKTAEHTRSSVPAGNMWLVVGNQVKWRLPILPLDCSPLLTDFVSMKTAAENVYAGIHKSRKLLWQHAYSTATICLHDVRRLYAIVTLVQLAVLRVLDPCAAGSAAGSAANSISQAGNAEEEHIAKRVRHDTASVTMACGYSEQHVADAVKDLRTAGLLNEWSIDYNFERGRQTKPLNVAKLRPPTRAFAPPQATRSTEDNVKERRFALECAIVKAMKASRHVADITELAAKLAAGGALQFSVDAASIRAAVDSLASRDYIDTSDGSLRYVA